MSKFKTVVYFAILFIFCLNLCCPFYIKPKSGRHTRQVEMGHCHLPAHPENGKWIVFDNMNKKLKPGKAVKELTVLSYICNSGFKKFPDDFFADLICKNSKWIGQIPKCLKTCQTLHSTKNMTIKCDLNERRVSCDNPLEDTRATYKCLSNTPLYSYCLNGTWYRSEPKC